MIGLVALAAASAAYPVALSHQPYSDEAELARMINDYRAQEGLPPVPVSRSLNAVAEAHVRDLMDNRPDSATAFGGGSCNMHSWSAAGPWKPVCYTRDHARASAMWSKPREVTRGAYPGNGFEIAYWWSGRITPEIALAGWEDSRSHNELIVEEGRGAGPTGRRWGSASTAIMRSSGSARSRMVPRPKWRGGGVRNYRYIRLP